VVAFGIRPIISSPPRWSWRIAVVTVPPPRSRQPTYPTPLKYPPGPEPQSDL